MTARPQGARRHPSEAPRSRPDWRLLGILLVALVLRGGLLLVAAGNDERLESTDVPEYLSLARDLRGGYVDEADPLFEIGLKRTPAYPAFLALVLAASGGSVEWATFVGILIAVGTVGLTFALARDLFGPPAGYGAALLIAIDPASVAWSNFLQPESLFTLLLTGAVVLWYRAQRHGLPWQAAVAGLLVGVAILTRPVALYLPLVLVAVGWLIARVGVRQRIAVGLTFLIVSALPVAAWVTRNVAVTGVAFVSTVESLNMLYYRAAGAVAEEQGISVRQARQRLFAEVDGRRGPGENAAELARRRTALGVQTLLDHPVGAALTWVKGAARLLGGPARAPLLILLGEQDPIALDHPRKLAWVGLQSVILAGLYLCALVGAVTAARQRRWPQLGVLGALIAYFLLVSSGTESFSRFRVPMVPYLAVLGGCGAATVWVRVARR